MLGCCCRVLVCCVWPLYGPAAATARVGGAPTEGRASCWLGPAPLLTWALTVVAGAFNSKSVYALGLFLGVAGQAVSQLRELRSGKPQAQVRGQTNEDVSA